MNTNKSNLSLWKYLCLISTTLLLFAPDTRAATFNVAAGDAAGLVAAVNTANGNGEADTINLADGVYTLTAQDNNTFGSNGLPAIMSQITINGNGATITRGAALFRIFYVSTAGNLTLNNITLNNGYARGADGGSGSGSSGGGAAAGLGGAVLNQGTLTINGSTLFNNTARGGNGGDSGVINNCGSPGGGPNGGSGGACGLYNEGGAGGFGSGGGGGSRGGNGGGGGFGGGGGGGFYGGGGASGFGGGAGGTNSSYSAGGGGGAGLGGGIFNFGGSVTITNSTLSGNAAQGGGGGAGQYNANGLSGVGSPGQGLGGGLFNLNGTVQVIGGTFAANSGGAVYNLAHEAVANQINAADAVLTIRNVILADSTAASDLINNQRAQSAVVNAAAPNIVETTIVNTGGTINQSGVINVDPKLGALAENGGLTETHALSPFSPAVDKGGSFGSTTDQRGFARPFDIAGVVNAGDGADIGAFELRQSEYNLRATHLSVTAPSSATAGTQFAFTVTALNANNNPAIGYLETIHFTSTDPNAVLPADYTFTNSDNGSHVFTATLKTAGNQTITATDTTFVTIAGASNQISVAPATATRLAVSAPPTAAPGMPFNFTVTVFDAYNNVVPGYAGTIHFTGTDGAALPADYTFVAADNGTHQFSATLNAYGSHTITATDTANAALTGTSNQIAVQPTNSQTGIVVTRADDRNQSCLSNDCSLREAIAAAQSGGRITFASPLFDAPQIITLSDVSGFRQLNINKNLTIIGKGADLLTVRRSAQATANFRIFTITSGTVNISGLTVTGGNIGNVINGGGFSNGSSATLTLSGVYITGNNANAGAILNTGTLNLINSTISGNTCVRTGGIFSTLGSVRVINSTISGNRCSSITNGLGGGIYAGNLTVTNSTVTDNETANGGGIYLTSGTASIGNSIIAGNRATNDASTSDIYDPSGTISSQGYNLVGSGTIAAFNQIGDQTSVADARLDALANYGGTMPTHRLKPDSPAIDKGKNLAVDLNNNAVVTTDARGFPRPANLPDNIFPDAPSGDGSDIGAYEYQLQPTAASVSISGRVATPQEFGLTNAFVILTNMAGNSRVTQTGKFGSFRFANVTAGETYILTVRSKRYTYAPQIITPNEDLTDVNFSAQ